MRILYLHQYFNTPRMVGGTRSYEMARRLVEAGHSVDMVTSDCAATATGNDWRVTEEQGIRVHWLPVPYNNHMGFSERIRAFLRFGWKARAKAAALPCDVVFATSTPLTIAVPGVHAARRQRVPLVFEVRDLWPEVPIALGVLKNPVQIALARRLERYAYHNATRIVALAPGMKDHIARAGIDPERIEVIPNGADFDLFTDAPAAGRRLRAATPWLGDRPLILYPGTLGAVNNTGYLVRVAEHLRAECPEARIVLVGKGREEAALRAAATAAGVLDSNLFIVPPVAKMDIPAWFGAADLVAVLYKAPPSAVENTVQNKFFDALASGTPICFEHQGWTTQLAEDAGAGVRLPPEAPAAAARILGAALRDRDGLARAGAAASALARERFSRDDLAARLERVLLDACRDFKGGA